MVLTPKARNHFTPLLVLTLTLLGLAGGLTVPFDSAKWPSQAAFIDQVDATPPAGQTVAIPILTPPDVATEAHIKEAYGKLLLSFEANHGQTDLQVKFLARGSGCGLFLTPAESLLTLRQEGGERS